MENPLIELRGVTKRFSGRTVLDKVDLKIFENEITTIIGKSGTGKTVLLKHIIGLLQPDEGAILFNGHPLTGMSRKGWREYRRSMSYLFQHNALFDSMTVFENVALPLRQTTKMSRREIDRKVTARLQQTDLADEMDKYPSELSGGMQKRVALARALVSNPKIVLFDEPTTGQDPIRKTAILSMIARYRKKFGFTAILVSHDIPDVFFVSDRIVLLWEGTVGFQGSYEEAHSLKHPMIDEFLKSLEGFQDELTGLLSKEAFRSRYASLFAQRGLLHVSGVLFVLEFESVQEILGEEAAVEVMKGLGERANRRFQPLGGFSARFSRDEILTILPHTSSDEADELMRTFAGEIEQEALRSIEGIALRKLGTDRCFEVTVKGGLTQVFPADEIDQIVLRARSDQRVIAVHRCNGVAGGSTPLPNPLGDRK